MSVIYTCSVRHARALHRPAVITWRVIAAITHISDMTVDDRGDVVGLEPGTPETQK